MIDVLRIAAGVPLVLVLPGYAVSRALFAEGVDVGARVLWTLALSIALTILAALGLDAAGIPLTGLAFAAVAAEVTVIAGLVAVIRGARPAAPRPRLDLLAAAAVLTATFVALLVWLRDPDPNPHVPGFTGLSAVRADGALRVGVESSEPRPATYRLEVVAADGVIATRTLTLAPGERWTGTVGSRARLRARTVRVRLAMDGEPYRNLILRP